MSNRDFSRFGFPFDPWRAMTRLADDAVHAVLDPAVTAAQPPVRIYGGDADLLLTVDIPGVDPEAVGITVQGDLLTICGERSVSPPNGTRRTLRRERPQGRFSRRVRLPFNVVAERVSAKARDGVLYVTLPKADPGRARHIDVEAE